MKYLIVIAIFFLSNPAFSQTPNPNYDAELAEKLQGDDYGMKMYVLAILTTGGNDSLSKMEVDSCFKGHMSNMERMAEEGKLIVAGPLAPNPQAYRGIFILDVPLEKAKELLKTDPAINAGLLGTVIIPWYGSAALPEYLPASDKIWKSKP